MGNLTSQEISPEELELFSMEVDEEYNPISEQDKVHAKMKYRMRKAMQESILEDSEEDSFGHERQEHQLSHKVARPTPVNKTKEKSRKNIKYVFEDLLEPDNHPEGPNQ